MAGLHGNVTGVGKDIVDYLTAVATFFNLTIRVTSGYRDAAGQGRAMFDNWIKLKRGMVYKKSALPEDDRKTLDDYYKTAKEDHDANAADKKDAEAKFLKLASDKVGGKSLHTKGRAVDVSRATVSSAAYTVITKKMKEVQEGSRKDIYHFESAAIIPAVTDAEKKTWGTPVQTAMVHQIPFAGGDDLPCICVG
jgi:hypothetical protein